MERARATRADPDAELDLLVLARLDVEVHRRDGRNLLARHRGVRAGAGGGAERRHGTVLPIFLGPAFSLYRIAARARTTDHGSGYVAGRRLGRLGGSCASALVFPAASAAVIF